MANRLPSISEKRKKKNEKRRDSTSSGSGGDNETFQPDGLVKNMVTLLFRNVTTLFVSLEQYSDWPTFSQTKQKGQSQGSHSFVSVINNILVPECRTVLDLVAMGLQTTETKTQIEEILDELDEFIWSIQQELAYVRKRLDPDGEFVMDRKAIHMWQTTPPPPYPLVITRPPALGDIDILVSPFSPTNATSPSSSASQPNLPPTPTSPTVFSPSSAPTKSNIPNSRKSEESSGEEVPAYVDNLYGDATKKNLNQKVMVFETILENLQAILTVISELQQGDKNEEGEEKAIREEEREENLTEKPGKGKKCVVQNHLVTYNVSTVIGKIRNKTT